LLISLKTNLSRTTLRLLAVFVVLFFSTIAFFAIGYFSLGLAIGGLTILGAFIAIQYPVFRFVMGKHWTQVIIEEETKKRLTNEKLIHKNETKGS